MNKKIMIVWFILVFLILTTVLVIGLNEKDLNYIKFEYKIKLVGRKHIKEKKIKTKINDSYVIFIDDIKDKLDNKKIEEYCIDSINYYNGLIFDKYSVIRKCKDAS